MKRLVISLSLVFFGIVLLFIVHVRSLDSMNVPGCRQVKFPKVCETTFQRCSNMGLDDACLAVAQLEGEIGHSVTQVPENAMSQNTKTGEL